MGRKQTLFALIMIFCFATFLIPSSPSTRWNNSEVFASASSNWGQFHGDYTHNGYYSAPGPQYPVQIWNYTLSGTTSDGLIAIGNDLIASSPSGNTLQAFSETSGSYLYSFQGQGNNWKATYPASDGNLLYSVGSTNSGQGGTTSANIIADNLSNGNNIASAPMPTGQSQSPFYGEDMIANYQGYVYGIGFDTPNITAVLPATSSTAWQISLGGNIDTIPTIGNGVLVVGYSNINQITAVNATTGLDLWNFTTDAAIDASPAYDNGSFFFGTTGSTFYSVNETGALQWSTPMGTAIETTPSIAYGLVYFGTDNGYLFALNEATGTWVWRTTIGGQITSPPVVASNNLIYQVSPSGNLYAMNAAAGNIQWTYALDASVLS